MTATAPAKGIRVVGVGLLALACVQTGQLMHRGETEAKQERKIQALYIALEREQQAIRQAGQEPTSPNPSVILNTPGVILGDRKMAEAGG